MEFSSQTLVPGVRFSPNDQQLVQYYLYPKVTKPLFTTSAPIRECDLYAYQPLQIWNKFHRIQGEDVFLFTKLKKKSPTSNVGTQNCRWPRIMARENTMAKTSVSLLTNITHHCEKESLRL
ncbi:hypothetical protein OIU78_020855 [Salix suchowensis]|nr:hypothetical protein OIU78_020855 [Salix suchowensis]